MSVMKCPWANENLSWLAKISVQPYQFTLDPGSSIYFCRISVSVIAGWGCFREWTSSTSGLGEGWRGTSMPESDSSTIKDKIPRKQPCALPPGRGCSEDEDPLNLTVMVLFVKYEQSILSSHPGTPQSDNLIISFAWEILLSKWCNLAKNNQSHRD